MFLNLKYPKYTYDDYKNWEGRWELIDGIPYAMTPMPPPKHQRVSNNIAWQLNELLKDCEKCKAYLPVDWKIDENTVVQPDNLVLCYEVGDKPYITKAPTLIFEILSKSTAFKDLNIKYKLYEKEGVKYYVVVNVEDTIAKVYELKDYRFVKIADAINDKVKFDLEGCEIEFDFSLIWE
ncbi:Uma2 family endonuclease [Thermodesulfatator atlanticus]|uniref:Uma2 family endonuclease n=1 Tax=Thermodesulfatator atlanticus TaxID=501497 RepID=UPI0003B37FF0|nr:Uma2 family endonuclease [Thermodesulfatator atlanticus]